MASPQNVELEAAKFLHKLIQDSKDEPAKLATKLYVILQHMKSSGKEHSMPYQVISRAMETVINQHGLDIEALKSSRLPLTGGPQIGSSSQVVGGAKDSRAGLAENEAPKMEPFASGRPPIAPTGGAPDYYQGTVAQRSNQSFDQGSPSSLDSRSANSQSQDRRDAANWDKQVNQKDGKKGVTKRKRGDSTSPVEMHVDSSSLVDPRNTGVTTRKGKMTKAEPSDGIPAKSGEMTNYNAVPNNSQMEVSSAHIAPGKLQGAYARVHGGMAGPANVPVMNEPDNFMIGRQNSGSEMTMLRQGVPPRDTGKSPVPATSSATPFKENQLKQLRAQCLVFLAFRNGLPPKKLHLEVAFGTFFSREDGSNKDLNDPKGKSQSFNEPGNAPGVIMPFGNSSNLRQTDKTPPGASSAGKFLEAESLSKGTEGPRMLEDKGNLHSDIQTPSEDRKHLAAKRDVERRIQERVSGQSSSATPYLQKDSSSHLDDSDNGNLTSGRANQPSVVGLNNWTGFTSEASKGPPQISTIQHELPIERRENIPSQFQNVSNSLGSWNHNSVNHLTSYSLKEHWKPVPVIDSNPHGVTMMKEGNALGKNVSGDQGGNERSVSADLPSSKKFTMSERWIMDQQKKRRLVEQNYAQKQQKAREKMTTCFYKLKENVSSCEDISAKTKSVIELKKLQLFDLQRRLRSDFLNDFFKPITTEVEHLKLIKKSRHGRRNKQLERYELKMKEERQKRIRERQKEFFSEIEVHKEKLDDIFKTKRERGKGFNKYVKEFHKRKERIHREKIDRIQREKINLLKINDVEGYLRMVQDAKSDRVKQLLKATEKYLQKLGSKLQEAKAAAGRLGHDVDDAGCTSFLENSETTLVDEDESDQAKHYMESNEKYYKMAHSVKESIAEQPSILHGGKLREYQMNGLRWLVSLYNNHLNGILADEMGLGKTVQVISLICYLMETKNDRGPFLVVVPSSVLPGWESEINFWAPSIHKIVYAGPPEERRRLFKERIVHQKFNVLLTTYEYLMNKHDRPKLSKVHWHYIIIDEGHRIKNASCKLNADLKHYQSSHRLLLTGTPLQNNLEELWALLNFLLPNIFNSSEDFSQWFNKPFESTGDNSPDEALLSEEENLLIINRLHQVLRPFVLRRLKHKVENQLPSKIERLIRCEASSYQKLLMKRVEDNLGAIGTSKARSVHNSVMELRNICNHPYLSQLHTEEVDNYIPKHYLPPIIRLCGKLETLDRVLPKLKATDHRVLFFSTMTRLLDVMEEYLTSKQYRYLRLDGHTSGGDRGALIDLFNNPDSPYFIFLLSIRAGGVGVNLQAADTVILFDTDWNPQVDLQAQARAHRIGQKRDVLVLRFETVKTVEEQVRASAEHKLGVANQSITAGFFDNNTSAEDRREYLESLLRECKKEEDAPVLDDDALNDVLARSESELDVFEAVDRKRKECELATWKKLVLGHEADGSDDVIPPPLPPRLVTDEDLEQFNEAMKIYDVVPKGEVESNGVKRKRGALGGLDTQHYGRGKRAREVRSYEEQWTEEEFEKMCQAETQDSPKVKVEEMINTSSPVVSSTVTTPIATVPQPASTVPQPAATVPQPAATVPKPAPTVMQPASVPSVAPTLSSVESSPVQQVKEITTTPAKRGRGRPKRVASDKSPAAIIPPVTSGIVEVNKQLQKGNEPERLTSSAPDSVGRSIEVTGVGGPMQHSTTGVTANIPLATTVPLNSQSAATPMPTNTGPVQQSNIEVAANALPATPMPSQSASAAVSAPTQAKGQGQKTQSGRELPRRRGKKQVMSPPVPAGSVGPDVKVNEQIKDKLANPSSGQGIPQSETVPSIPAVHHPTTISGSVSSNRGNDNLGAGVVLNSQTPLPSSSVTTLAQTAPNYTPVQLQSKGQIGAGAPRRRGKKQAIMSPPVQVVLGLQHVDQTSNLLTSSGIVDDKATELKSLQENNIQESKCIIQDQASQSSRDLKSLEESDDLAKQAVTLPSCEDSKVNPPGQDLAKVKNADVHDSKSSEITPSKIEVHANSGNENLFVTPLATTDATKDQHSDGKIHQTVVATKISPLVVGTPTKSLVGSSATTESISGAVDPVTAQNVPSTLSTVNPSTPGSESVSAKRQGRNTQNRVEPPRRRGRKSAPVLSATPDAHVGQDPKLSHHAQISPVSSLVGIATSNVPKAQAVKILLPSGVANDSKRKERAADPAQNKQQKVVSTRIDSAPVSSDKIAAFGRLHNVNDVARVMKEVFSGTCLPKPKAGVEASGSQSVEDKKCSDIETSGAACHTGNVAAKVHEKQSELASDMQVHEKQSEVASDMQVHEKQSEVASDMQVHEKKSEVASDMHNLEGKSSLDTPTTGALSLTTALPVKGNKQESDVASDQSIILENTALPDITENTSNEKLEPCEPSTSFACDDNSMLVGQAEILSNQPKVTPPSPATDPYSRTLVVCNISESAETNSRSETESSLKASAELSLEEGIVGNTISASSDHDRNNTEPPRLSLDPASPSEPSSKALEPSMKQHSESSSEKEGPVSPKAVQVQKRPDALEPANLHETPLVKSFSESLSEEKRDVGDSISEAVVTDIVSVSETGSLGEETVSETTVLPPSTLVKEQNRGSVPLEESMEKAVANCSGVQEEAKVDKMETDGQMDSSTRGVSTISSSSDGLKDSKIEQGDKNIFEVGDDTLKISSPSVKKNEISSSGNDCSEGHSMSQRVSLCSDDLFGKPGVGRVDELSTVPGTVQTSLSQLKEGQDIGVSSDNKLVAMSDSQKDIEGSDAGQINCSDRLQSGHLVTVSQSSEDALLSMKGTQLEVEISDQIDATQVSEPEDDRERLTNMGALPSCSPVKEDNVDAIIQDEQRDPLILEGSCIDGTKDSVANPLPQEESQCSEAETVHQIKVSDCDMVDPGLTSESIELPLSVMDEDKVDVSIERDILCNPLAGAASEENQMDDNEESKPSEAEIGHQIEASADIPESCAAEIANASQVPNSSALVEKEEGLSPKGIDGSTTAIKAAVGDGVDISESCAVEIANVSQVPNSSASGEKEAGEKEEGLSKKGIDGSTTIMKAAVGDGVDISESCATEIANVSQVPNSSAPVEKEEGLSPKGIDGSTAAIKAVVGDGVDISESCAVEIANVSQVPNSSASGEKEAGEKEEGLSEKGIDGSTTIMKAAVGDGVDISESCAAEIANVSQVPNSSAPVEQEEGLSPKGIYGSTAAIKAAVGDGVEISESCAVEIANVFQVPNSSASGEKEAGEKEEGLSEKGIDVSTTIMKAAVGDGVDIPESCATEIANVSQVPNSSAPVEKEEGLSPKGIYGSTAAIKAAVGDGVDISESCAVEITNVSQVPNSSASGEKEAGEKEEGLSEKGIDGSTTIMKAAVGDGVDISESCAAEIANVSQIPNSSASGEKEEGLSEKGVDGSTAAVGDGVDISSVCSSAAVSEHVECLSEKDLIGNSEADVTKQNDEVAQEENAPKDRETQK
ncbi:chromatin structure-remodeling complex protein SYD-like isoform X2 [Trifolium pratense]|uniref:chromatin structure-remodeling complex protein SYD-like isoform X2 n=1 Tax=Trifolium pratense TaxID=57577 RepID=UPI001E6958F8|nr:chromatin structure-remodeling complex protein SYD-like isoform X2 [Trifolium pratense]